MLLSIAGLGKSFGGTAALGGIDLEGRAGEMAWLARNGDADWTFATAGTATRVIWDYAFTLTSVFAWPLAAPLLHIFMRGAMRRCLAAMAQELEKTN